ncbi:cytochrome P450 [Streptomyces spectabilis]|uniref:Cytochrome P450 n=1 Tax=Streptomyces spectabilis TaxID=68270 RepID=A0A7W8B6P1_STRST|nr:cytochrome P450 [Streptomyces spectabilis]MBB5109568.1 cytochrome P450 [Streptomyces spectabilis]GGV55753.1 cytochrome P450 hydroxylase [Streptomyces spectabilis]
MRLADAVLHFPFVPAPYGEPPVEYARLRKEAPVTPVILPTGHRVWLVTTYKDALTVGSDPRFSRDVDKAGLAVSTGADFFVISGSFMYMDPPEHTRLRRVVQPFFTPRYLRHLSATVEHIADGCFDRFTSLGPPGDLVGQLAYPFTLQVTCHLLGIKEADVEASRSWAEVIPSLTRSTAAEIEQAAAEMSRYLRAQLDVKRTEPRNDLLTALVSAQESGQLSEREVLNLARLMFFAGQDSPTNLITRGTLLLIRHPDQWAALCADLSLVDGAVEEILRYSMTSGTGLTHAAVATQDVTLSGVRIRAGEAVVCPLIAANRDPSRFTEPDTFDITRTDATSHIAFGKGIHYCLGAPMARIQLRVAFRNLARRFPEIRRTDTTALTWSIDLLPNRIKELNVTW